MKRQRIELKDQYDLNDLMSDMFDDFLQDFQEREGLKRSFNDDDYQVFEIELAFMYTEKGMALIERYRKRMFKIFSKYWNELDFDMRSGLYVMP
tara:strand:+ start:6068 stop:6349 length:282 start_codon:yes stop_codon:yes gene_type:complete